MSVAKTRTIVALLGTFLVSACALHPYKTAPGWAAPTRVPAELTEPVPEPVLPADATNGDLAEWSDRLRAALREANEKLKRIRGL